jgi:acetyl esterase/lipase
MFRYTSLYFDDPPVNGRAIDVWIPSQRPLRPQTLFFVHGGGWRQGRRDLMHALMREYYEKGFACVSVDYRLGSATVPVQLSDVREGLVLADAHLREQGISQPFVLHGGSAGGHLALLAGLAPQGDCGESFSEPTPSIVGIVATCAPVTFEPWEDIFPGGWASMQEAVGVSYEDAPLRYKEVSPERYATADSPPMLFLLGECEHMFPNPLTIAFVRRLQALGGSADYRVYPAAEHGFFYSLERKSQRMAFEDVLTFLEGLAETKKSDLSGRGEAEST